MYTGAGTAETDNGPKQYTTRRSTWMASDGWAWAHQTGEDAAWYIFSHPPKNYDLNAVPADPTLMEA